MESKAADQVELSWKRHRLVDIGLELDLLDGPPVSEGAAGGITYAIQQDRGVKIRVASGPGSDLAGWRGFYPSQAKRFGGESVVTVCGTTGRRQEAEVAPESATGIYQDPDGKIGHIYHDEPAVVSVAVAFAVRGQPVLVEWAVPAADRERYRAGEKHFLASITCL